ncbi:MAG: hypothetical protein Q7T57_06365 [Dehalococcoidales bacterium]|nr:hypothetical protein [Dehalococcoidales bacterium]
MFRCYILHELCSRHIPRKESFTVILQYPAEVGGQPNGACQLLRFQVANGDGDANGADEIICESSPSATLPTAWANLLITPPSGENIYYITDGIAPFVASVNPALVHILEVSSPQQSRWKSFANGLVAGLVEERYMPLASLVEMEHLMPYVGSSLSLSEIHARYRILGGSVRGVLVKANKEAEELVQQALSHATSLDAILSSSTMSGELQGSGLAHIPSTLIHFRVIEEPEPRGPLVDESGEVITADSPIAPAVAQPFSRYEAVFASNHIRGLIRHKFRLQFVSTLGELVRTADLPYTSVLQGNLYEEFVHQRIQAPEPNSCEVRSLEAGGSLVAPIELCAYPCVEFDDTLDLAAMKLQEDRYYKPISRSFGAVDFVLGRNIVGNMTLNLRHGISITALLRVVRAMSFKLVQDEEGKRPVLRFFWLLPNRNLFKRMKKQPLSHGGRVISSLAMSQAASPASSSSHLSSGQTLLKELNDLVELQQFAVHLSPAADQTEEETTVMEITEDTQQGEEEAQPMEDDAAPETVEGTAGTGSGSNQGAPLTRKRKVKSTEGVSAPVKRGVSRGGRGGGRGGTAL